MKRLSIAVSLIFCLSGCAYNSVTISADNGSTVNCTSSVDKPVSVDTLRNPAIQGNVPLQGGAVNYPSMTVTGK